MITMGDMTVVQDEKNTFDNTDCDEKRYKASLDKKIISNIFKYQIAENIIATGFSVREALMTSPSSIVPFCSKHEII